MNRPSSFNRISPSQAIAICTRDQAGQLVEYDGHCASVLGRAGVLLTKPWIPLDVNPGPFVLTVVFHGIESAPPVPEAVQALIDSLTFQVRGQPR